MSRRSKPARRIPLADPVYNSVDISKFINRIMRRGKKSLAEKIFYATMEKIKEQVSAIVAFNKTTLEELGLQYGEISDRLSEGISKMKNSRVFSTNEIP